MIRKFLQEDGSYLISSKRRNLGYVKSYNVSVRKEWGDGRNTAGMNWVVETRWMTTDINGAQMKLRGSKTMWEAIDRLCSDAWYRHVAPPTLPGKKTYSERPNPDLKP